MLVKGVFKQLYNYSILKQNPIWEIDCNCSDDSTIQKVEELFQTELMILFQFHNASEKVIPIIHLHFDEIISWKQRSKTTEHKEIFSYLQLTWGICVTTQLNWDGEFIYCFEVFMKSVFDKLYKNGEQYDLAEIKVYDFFDSKRTYIRNSKEVVDQWFSQLYYYSKSFSGMNEWCEYFFNDIYYDLNENLKIKQYHPQLLSNLLSWCEVNCNSKASRAIRNIIEREYNLLSWSKTQLQSEMKSVLGLQLLLCKDYKNNGKVKLCDELEQRFGLNPLSRMQSRIALCYNEESLIANIRNLSTAIEEFNDYLEANEFDTIDSIYQRARIFKNILNTPISIAINIGNSNIVEELLIKYYKIKNAQEKEKVLFIVPNQFKRVAYCYNNSVIFDKKETQDILTDIVEIENRAFNTFRLLKGGFTKNIIPTNKPVGLPIPKVANEYETKLLELFNFTLIKKDIQKLESLIQFDFNTFPLQALMTKAIQKTLPINLSLSEKLIFPKVEKVLFWSGFSQTSEIEKDAMLEIFEYAEIQFEIHNEENSNLIQFTNRINELDPEIVWISSHGEYIHYEPNLSAIKLSETESIDIRNFELLINKKDKRRLLFLNICEGGVHSQTGEFKNVGFPNLLVAHNQDIISHLWMAEPRFAYTFGVLLALGIAVSKKNYFEAFEYSLSKVLTDKASILESLETYPLKLTALKERIQNNDGTEWGNIITTGSPVYNI